MVVNSSGYRANEVGKMLGVTHPVTSMEHMYFLTEPIEQIMQLDKRVPIIRDPGDDFYGRQEKTGLLVGVYEHNCHSFGLEGIDPHFTKSLCPSDLDRCLDNMEGIFERLPCLAEIGHSHRSQWSYYLHYWRCPIGGTDSWCAECVCLFRLACRYW